MVGLLWCTAYVLSCATYATENDVVNNHCKYMSLDTVPVVILVKMPDFASRMTLWLGWVHVQVVTFRWVYLDLCTSLWSIEHIQSCDLRSIVFACNLHLLARLWSWDCHISEHLQEPGAKCTFFQPCQLDAVRSWSGEWNLLVILTMDDINSLLKLYYFR